VVLGQVRLVDNYLRTARYTNGHFVICIEVSWFLKKYKSAVQKKINRYMIIIQGQVHDHNTGTGT